MTPAGQVLGEAAAEIVQPDDLHAQPEAVFGDVRADEARRARDEDPVSHGATITPGARSCHPAHPETLPAISRVGGRAAVHSVPRHEPPVGPTPRLVDGRALARRARGRRAPCGADGGTGATTHAGAARRIGRGQTSSRRAPRPKGRSSPCSCPPTTPTPGGWHAPWHPFALSGTRTGSCASPTTPRARSSVRETLRALERSDARVRVAYRPARGHISAASNTALSLVRGPFVALLDHDDELAPDALLRFAAALRRQPGQPICCTPTRTRSTSDGRRTDVHLKPDWSPDLFLSQNFVSHLGVYRTDLVRQGRGFPRGLRRRAGPRPGVACRRAVVPGPRAARSPGPVSLAHHGAVDVRRSCGARTMRSTRGAAPSRTTWHGRGRGASVERTAYAFYRVRYEMPEPSPVVSLIAVEPVAHRAVPSAMGWTASTWTCVASPRRAASPWPRRSTRPCGSLAGKSWCSSVRTAYHGRAGSKSWSPRPRDPRWASWVGRSSRAWARCVTPDTCWPWTAAARPRRASGHPGDGTRSLRPGRTSSRTSSAVGSDGLAFRREIFERPGGFDTPAFPEGLFEVDFCLRARERGLRVVFTPYAQVVQGRSTRVRREGTPEEAAEAPGAMDRAGSPGPLLAPAAGPHESGLPPAQACGGRRR